MSEFRYLGPEETDTVVSLVWQLAQELHVTRQRLLVLEDVLAESGVLGTDAVEEHAPGSAARVRLAQDKERLLGRLVRVLTETDDHRAPMREQFLSQLAQAED